MDSPASDGHPSSKRRRLVLIAGAAASLALLGGGGWLGYAWFMGAGEVSEPAAGAGENHLPLDGIYTQLPDIVTGLPRGAQVARLGLVLETRREREAPTEPQLLRITEEVRRWVAAQAPDELTGPAALWTVRARSLAIARQLYPELAVRDVLIRVLLVQ